MIRIARFRRSGLQLACLVTLAGSSLCLASCRTGDTPVAIDSSLRASADSVLAWNQKLFEVAGAEDGFLTLKGLRSATLFHLAVGDGIQALSAQDSRAPQVAVVSGAGTRIGMSQYPDSVAEWQSLRDRFRDDGADEALWQRGFELGSSAAERWLESREADGWNREAAYDWHPMAPGVYAEFNEHSGTPEGFVFGAGWARVTPFAMSSGDQFVVPPPPEISSDEYSAAFEEVKRVGRFDSTERTPDQSHFAMWWKEFVESSHNRLARELVREADLELPEANRALALLNVAIHDAYVSSFHNKFLYNHWRPYTAIRWAEHDGNPETEADPEWDNLHRHTYAFPSYPSAHGTACAAAMTVLADVFGESRPFEMTIPEVERAGPLSEKIAMEPPTRSFQSFAEAAEECSESRVYLGIHFRYDSVAGTELGRQVGRHVLSALGS